MTSTTNSTSDTAPARGRWWPDRAGYLAAGWAALYGVLALAWTATGRGYPYGPADPHGDASLLRHLPAAVGAPIFAALLLTAAVAALAMAGRHAERLRGVGRQLLLAYGWAVAAVLLLVVPDLRVLVILGYAPMLVLGAPFGWPPVDYSTVLDWSLANKAFAVVGGILLARAVLTWQRRTAGSCVTCGRGAADAGWTSAASAARWGRWAAWTAAVIPLCYAVTRYTWVLGIPLGISPAFLRAMQDTGLVWAGAGLATFATVGAVLTLGLVQRWGEVFPRWMVGLAGRTVPVMLAVVPASLVAIAVTAASVGELAAPELWRDLNLATAPALLFPLWGLTLGAATYGYYLRRRGTCRRCGRG